MFDLEPIYQGVCVDYVTIASKESDVVRIADGTSKSTIQLCNEYKDEELQILSFDSDSNFMILMFHSDRKIGRQGFLAVFYAVEFTGGTPGKQFPGGTPGKHSFLEELQVSTVSWRNDR